MTGTKKRRLALVTTARSDYSTMRPVMEAASADPEIEPLVFCGGMHWLPRFGETWRRIVEDGFRIAEEVRFFTDEDGPLSLSRSIGAGTTAFAEALARSAPDLVVVSGDRVENLALFAATTALRLPVAHLCGGDITEGAFDNAVRHAMTKLSHLHFPMMEDHARRVIQMGEEPWRVTAAGDPALDALASFVPLTRAELEAKAGIPREGPLLLSTFHPLTLGREDVGLQQDNILRVLEEWPGVPVVTYPNIDPGHAPLVEKIEAFGRRRPGAALVRGFTQAQYYSTMAHAAAMIGNSSSGIWEAPSFGLPVVNVGSRQAGRRRAGNVIDAGGTDLDELRATLRRATSPEFRESLRGLRNPYGDGKAMPRILRVLKSTPIDERLMVKKFHEGGAR